MDSLKYIGDKVVEAAPYIFPNLVCSFKKIKKHKEKNLLWLLVV